MLGAGLARKNTFQQAFFPLFLCFCGSLRTHQKPCMGATIKSNVSLVIYPCLDWNSFTVFSFKLNSFLSFEYREVVIRRGKRKRHLEPLWREEIKTKRGFCNKFEAKQNSRFVPFIIRFSWKKLKAEMNSQALLSAPVASLWVLISPFICSFSSSVVLALDNSCAYGKVFLCFYWVWKTGSALLGWSITPHTESPAV